MYVFVVGGLILVPYRNGFSGAGMCFSASGCSSEDECTHCSTIFTRFVGSSLDVLTYRRTDKALCRERCRYSM